MLKTAFITGKKDITQIKCLCNSMYVYDNEHDIP